jgi:predicted nucleic acid-binding protein
MTYFADTFYFLALLNSKDPAHQRARTFAQTRPGNILTTHYVLLEVADGMSDVRNRALVVNLIRRFRIRPDIRILAADAALFDAAFDLYARRSDKDWSLTDCTSFVVMRQHGLTDALTADHHFQQVQQAGFNPLLLT